MAKPKSNQKEEQIFQAALTLFATKGYTNTTIKEIAQEAGVSFGTVFTYYDTKESLFHTCVARPLKDLGDQIYVSRASLENFTVDSLSDMISAHLQLFLEQESYIRLIQYVIGQPQRFPEIELLDEFADEFVSFIEEVVMIGVEKGFIPESKPKEVGYGYLAFLNGSRLTFTDKATVHMTNALKNQALRLFGIN